VDMLATAVEQEQVGHAYLFTGPAHVGKTTLARMFAQALTCREATKPCGRCRTCSLISDDRHPDVRLVEPETSGRGKLTLKIEAIRDLQHELNLAAYEAPRKVAILRRFDAATTGAANAFLKTLEEPPSNVVLLLTAESTDALLPTITSRCRIIALRPLPAELIEQSLRTRWRVAEEEAHLLAHLADGRLGWAVRATQEPDILRARETHLDQLREALGGGRVTRFVLADKLARKPEQLPNILQQWLSWWRDLNLLAQRPTRNSIPITNIDRQAELEQLAQSCTRDQALASLKQTSLALWQLERNANTRLVVENLLLTYPLSGSGTGSRP